MPFRGSGNWVIHPGGGRRVSASVRTAFRARGPARRWRYGCNYAALSGDEDRARANFGCLVLVPEDADLDGTLGMPGFPPGRRYPWGWRVWLDQLSGAVLSAPAALPAC